MLDLLIYRYAAAAEETLKKWDDGRAPIEFLYSRNFLLLKI